MKTKNTMVKNDSKEYKYVFVCGLQRSGTSVLGRNVARLENCTGFKNTGESEDEGQFLQDVYPVDAEYGGMSRFGFDPRAHRTETSALLTRENVVKLRASWHAYWDNSKTIFVEKTPANLLMTRFLQAVFPNSYFIVIRRHPLSVSMAIRKWKVCLTPLYRSVEHWLHCHKLFEQDKKYLKHVYELTYEDYVENPGKYHHEIAAFIGTRVPEPPKDDSFRIVVEWRNPPVFLRVPERAMETTSGGYSKKYFDQWSYFLTRSPFRGYYRYIARKYEPELAKYGYSLTRGFFENEEALAGSKISAIFGFMYCLGADLNALLQRSTARTGWYMRERVKRVLPEFVLNRIRQARQRAAVSKGAAEISALSGRCH
jgi:sulfotransferase family protein